MPSDLIVLIAASLIAVVMMRSLPRAIGSGVVAGLSLLVLFILSWLSAVWLLLGIFANLAFIELGERFARRGIVLCLAILFHSMLFFYMRDLPDLILLGGAYFTLRQIHVVSDWWISPQSKPSFNDYLGYQLFLPVLAAGPIHRCGPFLRQLRRRRNDPRELIEGAERLLIGAFQYTFFGSWLMNRLLNGVAATLPLQTGPLREFVLSAGDWMTLYFLFAGLSSMSIGLALMMGVRIEENFNRPWLAKDLPDFWNRWHMSLTSFSRDYVFRPVSAWIGSGVLGAFSAMLFIGIWHGSSMYWVVWGIWQGIGVLLTVYARNFGFFVNLPTWMGRLFALGWLLASQPIASRIIEILS